MGIITFNNQSSEDIFVVEHPPEYEMAERNYNIVPIPGRNGDLTMDMGSYKNVNRSYPIAIGAINGNYVAMANAVSDWLHSASGYARLEDSYEPDYYKMAMYSEEKSIDNILQQAGRATITFNRMPQRFLKTGDLKTIIAGPQTLTNPTKYTALPIITVKGNGDGVLHVGDYTVTLTNIIGSIDLNCEIGDAYNGMTNLNMYVTVANRKFPKLVPGGNLISFTGSITSVEIVPKWWTI